MVPGLTAEPRRGALPPPLDWPTARMIRKDQVGGFLLVMVAPCAAAFLLFVGTWLAGYPAWGIFSAGALATFVVPFRQVARRDQPARRRTRPRGDGVAVRRDPRLRAFDGGCEVSEPSSPPRALDPKAAGA